MQLIASGSVEPKAVTADKEGNAAEGTSIQVLTAEGPNFVMREFTIAPGGHTPHHAHPWEHHAYILAGKGKAAGEEDIALSPGDALLVPGGEIHSFHNTGDEDMRMICVVPKDAG